MTLRSKLQATATRLTGKHGDSVGFVTVTSTSGATEFDLPTLTETVTPIDAVVTGLCKWDVTDTILATDLAVLVSGAAPRAAVGGIVTIDGKSHTIIAIKPIMAAGIASAVKYFVRRG
jgi:hypothetical protein